MGKNLVPLRGGAAYRPCRADAAPRSDISPGRPTKRRGGLAGSNFPESADSAGLPLGAHARHPRSNFRAPRLGGEILPTGPNKAGEKKAYRLTTAACGTVCGREILGRIFFAKPFPRSPFPFLKPKPREGGRLQPAGRAPRRRRRGTAREPPLAVRPTTAEARPAGSREAGLGATRSRPRKRGREDPLPGSSLCARKSKGDGGK